MSCPAQFLVCTLFLFRHFLCSTSSYWCTQPSAATSFSAREKALQRASFNSFTNKFILYSCGVRVGSPDDTLYRIYKHTPRFPGSTSDCLEVPPFRKPPQPIDPASLVRARVTTQFSTHRERRANCLLHICCAACVAPASPGGPTTQAALALAATVAASIRHGLRPR